MKSTALELRDLATVHAFYVSLLQETVGHPVPVPEEVKVLDPSPDRVHHSVSAFKRWLAILDMAISPPMVRDALKLSTKYESAEALLRYYIRKGSPRDREKADFVVTFLYRRSKKVPLGETTFQPVDKNIHDALEFEAELYKIMGDMKPPELPAEHDHLTKEFEFLEREVEEFRHFDALMDSGMVQRAREIKQSLGPSFYHPRVLATIAAYNDFFGARFEQLFKQATQQIKTFAAKVQQDGGSIMSRVEGDVMVKHLAEVEESTLLKQDYRTAMDDFHKVSRYKKAVDSRRHTRPPAAAPPARPVSEPLAAAPAGAVAPRGAEGPPSSKLGPSIQPLASSPQFSAVEDSKMRAVLESIRNFMRTADATVSVAPLRNANVDLSPPEIEAFRADFHGEKSFRAEYAEMLMQLVAIHTRMLTELAEYLAKKGSAYLWKPHADSLAYLLTAAERALEHAGRVASTAEKRGLMDKASALQSTSERVREQQKHVAKALQS